jgi:hypothetical protein
MSAPVKAIFARTQSQARAYARAFDLSPEEWSSFGLGAAIPGTREFERVVVVLPANVTSADFALVHRIERHLAENAAISLLSPHDVTVTISDPTKNPGDE